MGDCVVGESTRTGFAVIVVHGSCLVLQLRRQAFAEVISDPGLQPPCQVGGNAKSADIRTTIERPVVRQERLPTDTDNRINPALGDRLRERIGRKGSANAKLVDPLVSVDIGFDPVLVLLPDPISGKHFRDGLLHIGFHGSAYGRKRSA